MLDRFGMGMLPTTVPTNLLPSAVPSGYNGFYAYPPSVYPPQNVPGHFMHSQPPQLPVGNLDLIPFSRQLQPNYLHNQLGKYFNHF